MKMLWLIPVGFIVGLVGFLAWAAYPWSLGPKATKAEIIYVEPEGMVSSEEKPAVIKILTWNVGFLFGEGSEGPGYQTRDKVFFEQKLDALVRSLEDWQPDIILLQEIDFDSARSKFMDQAQYIAKKANYPYVAEALSWDAHYIPFPYWPISNHFGGMKSGGAILSRYPILDQEVLLLEKPASQPWWYNLFYLHRYLQKATIQIGDKKFKFINLHLEAFDKKNRQDQIQQLMEVIKNEKIDVVAGDFNMVPAIATKKSKFPNGDDYENDSSFDLMMKSGLTEVIPDDIYAKDESLYFTFPSSKPDRRLDYIFFQAGLKMMKAEILPSALSDHLPLRASFQIGVPSFNPYSQ